jgi:AcrR family transcriptional regulator
MSTEAPKAATRRYRKRLRAEQELKTREAITEAAVKLHGTVGPARTTVSGIAEEAGVQRATVYRHFPNEESLFAACSGHYMSMHPPPDPSRWAAIADPAERLREALTDVYRWWDETEEMMLRVIRDAALVESLSVQTRTRLAFFEQITASLMRGRGLRGKRKVRVKAAIGHALAFPTWQSLVRERGLTNGEAVDLMAGMVELAA